MARVQYLVPWMLKSPLTSDLKNSTSENIFTYYVGAFWLISSSRWLISFTHTFALSLYTVVLRCTHALMKKMTSFISGPRFFYRVFRVHTRVTSKSSCLFLLCICPKYFGPSKLIWSGARPKQLVLDQNYLGTVQNYFGTMLTLGQKWKYCILIQLIIGFYFDLIL